MEPTIPTTKETCALCSSSAYLACSACKDTPDLKGGVEKTYYCSKACQTVHWKFPHKHDCRAFRSRKALFHIGETLQQIFYLYRERLFDRRLARIEKVGKKLLIHDRKNTDEENAMEMTEFNLIQPFPKEMCESVDDEKAVLVHLACTDAIAWMHNLVRYMLADIAVEITERTVELSARSHKQEVIGVNIYGQEDTPDPHDLWRVVLNSGEDYALDLAGAQFGHHQPVTRWADYGLGRVKRHVKLIHRRDYQYFGGVRDRNKQAIIPFLSDPVTLTRRLNAFVSPGLIEGLHQWETESSILMKGMLELPAADFQVRRKKMVDMIDANIKERVEFVARKAALFKAGQESPIEDYERWCRELEK